MQYIVQQCWKVIEKVVYLVLGVAYRVLGKELTEQAAASFLQFVKFGIVGASNTIISYILYFISLLCFKKLGILVGSDYLVAQVIAFVLSVLWSFYWNNKMVFTVEAGKTRSLWRALLKTYVSYSFTGLLLNTVLLYLWVDMLNISEFVAPLINLIISVPVNFLINKFWAFK
jgi:putative flippase GtrA